MIRITQGDAVEQIQRLLVSLGAIPLDVNESGLIVITPAAFTKCIDAARKGAIEASEAERYYIDEGGNRRNN